MSLPSSRLRGVSRRRRCELCGGDHKCATRDDGLILCGRRDGPQDGFRHLGPTKDGPWHMYVKAGEGPPATPGPGPANDWAKRHRLTVSQLGEEARRRLRDQLGLPDWVFDTLPVGYQAVSNHGPYWLFPERDGRGAIVGVQRRFADGQKRNLGSRGLTLPTDWSSRPGPVFCVEGASDALALTALGLAAVGRPSNSGGLRHLEALLKRQPPDRPVVIVGERDGRPDGPWPGRDGAVELARRLGEALGRELPWALPPEGCKDVRDWVKARGLDPGSTDGWAEAGGELARLLLADVRPADELPAFDGPPRPLEPPRPKVPFPVDVFPEILREFAEGAAQALACPVDFVGAAMLAVAGAAVGNAWRVRLSPTHEQSTALYVALVGAPGSAKSPALELVAEPLARANREAVAKAKRAAGGDAALAKLTGPGRRYVVDDFTTEALVPVLAANPRGVAVVKDELAGLLDGLNQYKGGKGHDRQVLLSLWANAPVVVDRKSALEPSVLARPFCAILGGIQPAVLERMRPRGRFAPLDDGLVDRFLFAYPDEPPADVERPEALPDLTRYAWFDAVERLLLLPCKTDPAGHAVPAVLELPPVADEQWRLILRRHVDETNREAPELRGVWAKFRGLTGRLALITHALRWAVREIGDKSLLLDSDALHAGERLAAYFKAQAHKVHGQLAKSPLVAQAELVAGWLAERPAVGRFTRAELYQHLRRRFASPGLLANPLDVLVELGYLGRRRRGDMTEFVVNPHWKRG